MIRKRLFCGLVVIGRRRRIDAESDTREETIHEGLLRGDLEVLGGFANLADAIVGSVGAALAVVYCFSDLVADVEAC